MTTANDARKAHKILDDLLKGNMVLDEEREFLRSTLPELPKQKTLEEITADVRDAWVGARGNDWAGNSYDRDISIEDWMAELYVQLQGLKDVPATVPELPAGMRLADHEEYGRVVVSPGLNDFGLYLIFVLDSDYKEGAHWHCEHGRTLTFIDDEPAKPAHPEFLETEADYTNAPAGTIVAKDNQRPAWKPNEHWFINNNPFDNREMAGGLNPAPSRVLRWGLGE